MCHGYCIFYFIYFSMLNYLNDRYHGTVFVWRELNLREISKLIQFHEASKWKSDLDRFDLKTLHCTEAHVN